jgi:hypothetical protein
VGSRHIATGCLAAFVALPLLDVAPELSDQDLVACLLPVALMPLLAGYLWLSGARSLIARWVLVGLGFPRPGAIPCCQDRFLLRHPGDLQPGVPPVGLGTADGRVAGRR